MTTDVLEQCALTIVHRLVMHVAVEALHFSLSEQQVRMLQDLALSSKARTSNAASSSTVAATGTRSSSIDSRNSAVPKEGIGVQSSTSTTSTSSSSGDAAAAAAVAAIAAAAPSRATRLMTWWRGDSTVDTATTATVNSTATTAGSTQNSGAQGTAAGHRSSWRSTTASATATGTAGSAAAASSTAQLLQQQAYHLASLSISRVTLTLLTVSQQLRTPAASPPLRTQQSSGGSSTTVATTTASTANTDAHNTPPRHTKTLTAPASSPSVLLNSSIDENSTADAADDALSISVPVYGIGAVTVSTPATAHKKVVPHHQEPLLVLEVRHICNHHVVLSHASVCAPVVGVVLCESTCASVYSSAQLQLALMCYQVANTKLKVQSHTMLTLPNRCTASVLKQLH
jgi:hypothetical protein